ncbi:hypothetical protein [uncultured Vibrio sp.]|uniref:hypothetical protein n=1 Tax=uncultured Vibrio sp. TaxID=114054 RepID=UPI00260E2E6D|nr:hypothetical protein [uncultured Vibrio sp.]
MQIANNKDAQWEIANQYALVFPCIEQALQSNNVRFEIHAVQQRLLTYKELLLHRNILDDNVLKHAFIALTQQEKEIVHGGFNDIDDAIKQIDGIIERYSSKPQ